MYNYETEKKELFTDEGQRMLLKIRDKVHNLCKLAGCVRMQEAIAGNTGSSWTMIACVDRIVELGEIREIAQLNECGQYRVFVLCQG